MIARDTDYFRNVFDMEVLTQTRSVSIDTQAHTVDTINLETDKKYH